MNNTCESFRLPNGFLKPFRKAQLMRQWRFSAWEHIALIDLPVLPFLAPRLFKVRPFRSGRSTSSEPQPLPNSIKPQARRLSNSKLLRRPITGETCQPAAARISLATQRCHLHSSTSNNYNARQVDIPSQEPESNSANQIEGMGPRKGKYKPPQHVSSHIRERSKSALSALHNLGVDLQYEKISSSSPNLYQNELSELSELAINIGPDLNVDFKKDVSSKPVQKSARSNLQRIRFLGELSSRHPLRTSLKSLKKESSSSNAFWGTADIQKSTLGLFSRTWTETIAKIHASDDPGFPRHLREKYKPHLLPNSHELPPKPEIAKEFMKKYPSVSLSNSKSIKRHWHRLPEDQRSTIWPLAVLKYLSEAPRSALEFVKATGLSPLPPSYQLADLLDVNAMYLLRHASADQYASMLEVVRLTLQCYPTLLSMSQRTIWALVKYRNLLPIDAKSLYEVMELHKVESSHNTYLQFAYALAVDQEPALALKAFLKAVSVGADVRNFQVKLTAAKLLYELPSKNGYGAVTDLVAEFLSIDLELNVAIYNILMIKAFDSGDPATAWKIYDLFRSHGMKPDDHTYCIILRASRLTNDAPRYEEAILEIESLPNHTPSDTLLAEMLNNLYFFRIKILSQKEKFDRVLKFYAQHYDIKPLRRLGVVDRATEQYFKTAHNRLPTSWIVGMLLFVFLRTAKTRDCVLVYRNFRNLVERYRDPTLIELAAQPFVYDNFLRRICGVNSPLWQEVLADMATDLPNTINPKTNEQFVPPKPTTQTMNIILQNYAKRGDIEAVKRIFHLMGEFGLDPDVVTYTSIVGVHARKQDVRSVAESLKQMEDQGIAANRFTLSNINLINDWPGLVEALREIQDERQAVCQSSEEPAYAYARRDDAQHSL